MKQFWFNKAGVERLAELLKYNLGRELANGLDYDSQVCLTLAILGGNYFQRVGGAMGGVRLSQCTQL